MRLADDPRVVAALARMEARLAAPSAPRIEWRSYRADRCTWCKSKTALMIYHVRPIRQAERTYGRGSYERTIPAKRWSTLSATCLDKDACKARSNRAYEQRQRRSGTIRWAQSRFEAPGLELPKGTCRWCGEQIVLADPDDYRRRQRLRHRGDEHEVGERNCDGEYGRTFAFNGRDLVQKRGDPCCVDCGDTGERQFEDGGWYQSGDWEADHDVALEDGGAHCATNVLRRCCDCHRRKTAAENAARALRRREAALDSGPCRPPPLT